MFLHRCIQILLVRKPSCPWKVFFSTKLHKTTTLLLFYHRVLCSKHTLFGFAHQRKQSALADKLRDQTQACDVAGQAFPRHPSKLSLIPGRTLDTHFTGFLKRWQTNAVPISAYTEMPHSFLLALRTVFPSHL